MKIEIPTMNGFIPDCYDKFANADQKIEGKPSRSFPIFITDAPDKTHYYTLTVYALDTKIDLKEGYWLNDFLHEMEGHIIDSATISVPNRAK